MVCLGHFHCNIVCNVLFNWKPVIWSFFFLLCLLERKLGNENQMQWKYMWHLICPTFVHQMKRNVFGIELLFKGSLCGEINNNNWLWFCCFSLAVKFLMNTMHKFLLSFTLVRKLTLLSLFYIVHCFFNPKDKIETLKLPYLWRIKWKPCLFKIQDEKIPMVLLDHLSPQIFKA